MQYLDRTLFIAMNLSRSLTQLMAHGGYDWVNEDIEKFSFEVGEGSNFLNIHLLCYHKAMSTDAVLADMDHQGLRPIVPQELLWLGIQHPDLQREFPIVALGQVREFHGFRRVMFLLRSHSRRLLYLRLVGLDWRDNFRFGAVRKPR